MMTNFHMLTELLERALAGVGIILLATFAYTSAVQARGLRAPDRVLRSGGHHVSLALASPLAAIASGYSFSAHMMQHLLLLLIVATLAILACLRRASLQRGKSLLLRIAIVITMSWLPVWRDVVLARAPRSGNAAMQHSSVFAIQSTSLVAAGTAFWWPVFVLSCSAGCHLHAAAAYLFSGCVGCSLLGHLYHLLADLRLPPVLPAAAARLS